MVQPSSVPPQHPVWKKAAIAVLRGTIRVLNWAATELETESVLPPPSSADRLEQLRRASQAGLASLPLKLWDGFWRLLRPYLPESLQKLSNRNLSIVLSTTSVFLIWVGLSLLSPQLAPKGDQDRVIARRPEPPATVTRPSPPIAPPVAPSIAPTLTLPEPETGDRPDLASPVETRETDLDNPGATESTTAIADLADEEPAQETANQPANPPERPKPKLDLSPEQVLIASIETQVMEITDRDRATGSETASLVNSVRADFEQSRLIVTIDDQGWSGLSADRQLQLSRDLLVRSRQLSFSKLELRSNDGTLLARSPIVGNNPVIYTTLQS